MMKRAMKRKQTKGKKTEETDSEERCAAREAEINYIFNGGNLSIESLSHFRTVL